MPWTRRAASPWSNTWPANTTSSPLLPLRPASTFAPYRRPRLVLSGSIRKPAVPRSSPLSVPGTVTITKNSRLSPTRPASSTTPRWRARLTATGSLPRISPATFRRRRAPGRSAPRRAARPCQRRVCECGSKRMRAPPVALCLFGSINQAMATTPRRAAPTTNLRSWPTRSMASRWCVSLAASACNFRTASSTTSAKWKPLSCCERPTRSPTTPACGASATEALVSIRLATARSTKASAAPGSMVPSPRPCLWISSTCTTCQPPPVAGTRCA